MWQRTRHARHHLDDVSLQGQGAGVQRIEGGHVLYRHMKLHGTTVRLVWYPDEGHGNARAA